MTDGLLVVKIGGSTLGSHDTSLEDLAALHRSGRRIVVVHGGGPAINDWLKRLETPIRFVGGLRVTDAPALEVVVGILAGLVNKQLVAGLTALGAPAFGISGADAGMIVASYEDEQLGFVGRITRVDPAPIERLLDGRYLPVIAPLALLERAGGSPSSQLLNVNADTVAGEIACAMEAERLIFMSDVDGVRGANGGVLRRLTRLDTEPLLAGKVIAGGMIPKVHAGLRAADAGATCVILDGREAHGLLAALEGDLPGTVIARFAPREGAPP